MTLKTILESELGELSNEEYVFAMEQELLKLCQADFNLDVLNRLSTNIDFYRRERKEVLN